MKRFFAGVGVGVGNSIPGVSGGTILVILNLFEPLMKALVNIFKKDNKDRWKDIFFIGEIIAGAVFGILLASLILKPLLWYGFIEVMYFFIGLISLSTYYVFKKEIIKKEYLSWIFVVLGIIVVAYPILISTRELETSPLVPTSIDALYVLIIFLVGIIGGISMILPGISGSMILLLLGYYYLIYQGYLGEIRNFNLNLYVIIPLVLFALGVVIGIYVGGKFCDWAINKYRKETYSAILGMLIGSAISLIPFKEEHMINTRTDALGNVEKITYQYDIKTILLSILAFMLGVALIYLLESKANKKDKKVH